MMEDNFLAVTKLRAAISTSKEIEARAKQIASDLKSIRNRVLAVILLAEDSTNYGLDENGKDVVASLLFKVSKLCGMPVYFIHFDVRYWISWIPSSGASFIMNNDSPSLGSLGTAMMPLGAASLMDPRLDARQFAQDAEAAYRAYESFDWSKRSPGESLYTQFESASGDTVWKPVADRLSDFLANVRLRGFRDGCTTQIHLVPQRKLLKH